MGVCVPATSLAITAACLNGCAAPMPESRLPGLREAADANIETDWRRYLDFAFAHNALLTKLERLEAEADFELEWTRSGERSLVNGDALVWLDWPDRGMLNIRHLGDCYMWFGHDSKRAWLFTRAQDERTCWIALIQNAYQECCKDFPFGLPPHELRFLIGLGDLPTDARTFSLRRDGREWVVSDNVGTMERRVYLQADYGDVLRTELLRDGVLIVSSTLTGYVRLEDVPDCAELRVPMRYEIFGPADQARLSIRIHYCIERTEAFPSGVFQPSAIGLQMGTEQWIVLDENCATSARAPTGVETTPSNR